MSINKKTYSEQIYDVLKQDILTQKIPLGAFLINRDLQERFNVSSTPIRDAINRLWQDGLLEDITKVGSKVIELDLHLLKNVNEVMSILCTAAVELSLERADHKKMVESLWTYVAFESNHADDETMIEQDALFHYIFFVGANNQQLLAMYEQNRILWEMIIRHLHKEQRRFSDTLVEHREIVKAYEERDAEKSGQYMRQHFEEAGKIFEKMLANTTK